MIYYCWTLYYYVSFNIPYYYYGWLLFLYFYIMDLIFSLSFSLLALCYVHLAVECTWLLVQLLAYLQITKLSIICSTLSCFSQCWDTGTWLVSFDCLILYTFLVITYLSCMINAHYLTFNVCDWIAEYPNDEQQLAMVYPNTG